MDLASLAAVGMSGVILLLVAMFVARPLAVWASAVGTNLKTNEKLMISWVGPRGIVAAAISSLFAIRLQDQDLQGVELLVPLVFVIIIGTVLIQGLGAKMVGTLLKVREPANNGVLIVGANPVARMIANVIKGQGYEVVVADASYTNIAKARMEGLRTYYGNPVSDHAERHMDLIGIGHLFAMSTDRELNTLSEVYFRHEFGERNVYRLLQADEKARPERQRNQQSMASKWLFGADVTYGQLASMVSKKARVKVTNLTETYGYQQFLQDNKSAVPLFAIDKNGTMKVVNSLFMLSAQSGFKVVALVAEEGTGAKPENGGSGTRPSERKPLI